MDRPRVRFSDIGKYSDMGHALKDGPGVVVKIPASTRRIEISKATRESFKVLLRRKEHLYMI